MLCAASCSSVPQASIAPTALGNAYRVMLPSGTKIVLPDEASHRAVQAIAHNEVAPSSATGPVQAGVTLAKPLQLVSPAYMAERNTAEIGLLLRIEDLKEENARLRAR